MDRKATFISLSLFVALVNSSRPDTVYSLEFRSTKPFYLSVPIPVEWKGVWCTAIYHDFDATEFDVQIDDEGIISDQNFGNKRMYFPLDQKLVSKYRLDNSPFIQLPIRIITRREAPSIMGTKTFFTPVQAIFKFEESIPATSLANIGAALVVSLLCFLGFLSALDLKQFVKVMRLD